MRRRSILKALLMSPLGLLLRGKKAEALPKLCTGYKGGYYGLFKRAKATPIHRFWCDHPYNLTCEFWRAPIGECALPLGNSCSGRTKTTYAKHSDLPRSTR